MLEVSELCVSYGAITALAGISLRVNQGSIATLIGGNGAGKTTTLRTISGLLRPRSGRITFLGEDISRLPAHAIVARGIGHVPEGRMVFSNLTVDENLAMGAYLVTDRQSIAASREYVFGIFPRLRERRTPGPSREGSRIWTGRAVSLPANDRGLLFGRVRSGHVSAANRGNASSRGATADA